MRVVSNARMHLTFPIKNEGLRHHGWVSTWHFQEKGIEWWLSSRYVVFLIHGASNALGVRPYDKNIAESTHANATFVHTSPQNNGQEMDWVCTPGETVPWKFQGMVEAQEQWLYWQPKIPCSQNSPNKQTLNYLEAQLSNTFIIVHHVMFLATQQLSFAWDEFIGKKIVGRCKPNGAIPWRMLWTTNKRSPITRTSLSSSIHEPLKLALYSSCAVSIVFPYTFLSCLLQVRESIRNPFPKLLQLFTYLLLFPKDIKCRTLSSIGTQTTIKNTHNNRRWTIL